MMRQSETIRAARRLLLSHPIVCLLAAVAAVVVLGVLGPIKVVHAADVAPSSTTDPGTIHLVGAGDIGAVIGDAAVATGKLIQVRLDAIGPEATVFTAGDNAYPYGTYDNYLQYYDPAWGGSRRGPSRPPATTSTPSPPTAAATPAATRNTLAA